MKDTQVITNLTSLISTSFVVLTNILLNPLAEDVINANIIVMFIHNFLDLVLHLRTNDILLNTHHLLIINGVLYYYLTSIPLIDETKEYIAWLFMAEISSFFNSLRYNLVNTLYYQYSKIAFGVIFIIVRTISSGGLIGWLYFNHQHEHITAYSIISCIYIILNISWGAMIIRQIIIQKNKIYTLLGLGIRNINY
jgi:hypothetical protein